MADISQQQIDDTLLKVDMIMSHFDELMRAQDNKDKAAIEKYLKPITERKIDRIRKDIIDI